MVDNGSYEGCKDGRQERGECYFNANGSRVKGGDGWWMTVIVEDV